VVEGRDEIGTKRDTQVSRRSFAIRIQGLRGGLAAAGGCPSIVSGLVDGVLGKLLRAAIRG
jgi:hypothetical protein